MSTHPHPLPASHDIYGHADVKVLLRSLRAHTLLFVGPERTGRRLVARWYATLLNCEAAHDEPCGTCASCRAMRLNSHPDYREIQPQALTKTGKVSRKPEIRIDQLVPREHGEPEPLSRWLEQRPQFRLRMGVIDGTELMNQSAANAFLKFLEEPPSYARIVLIAPSAQAVMPTIVSRSVVVRFGTVPAGEVPVRLPAPHPAERLGRPGDLLEASSSQEEFAALQHLVREYVNTVPKSLEEAFDLAEALEKQWLAEARFRLPELLRAVLGELPPAEYAQALIAIEKCEEALASYASPSLAVQVLTLDLRAIMQSRRPRL
jgi:DNA polymerase-3 subunit delta'